jgi:hypothetical protein
MKKFTWVLAIAAIVGLSAPELDAKHHSKGHHHQGNHAGKSGKAHHAGKSGKSHSVAHHGSGKTHPIAHNAAKGGKANGAKHVQGKHFGGKGAKPAYKPMNRLAKN